MEVRIATGREELQRAYRLVYAAYRAHGYLEPHPARIRYRSYYALAGSRTLLAVSSADGVVGTATVISDGERGLPMESGFAEEVQQLRSEGRALLEVVSFAIPSSKRMHAREVFFRLTQFVLQYARWRQIDDVVIAVHPRRMRLYCVKLPFRLFGSCRPYGTVCGHPAVACRFELRNLEAYRETHPRLYEQYLGETISVGQFSRPAMSAADRAYFRRLMSSGDGPRQAGIDPIDFARPA